jgi:hypothetical protein
MNPVLSVVTPVFNAARYVEAAVASVLAQDFADFEFIIIDDGSTDGTAELLGGLASAEPRIRLLQQPNRGIVASMNRGLAEARGALVARMDADDLSLPGRFRRQVTALQGRPALAAVGGHVRIIGPDGVASGVALSPTGPRRIRAVSRRHSPLFHPAAMMRRDLVTALGGYRAVLELAEDYDLWLRLLDAGHELDNVPALVLDYRVHPSNLSGSVAGPLAARALMARAASAMRRAGLTDPVDGIEAVTDDALQQLPVPFRPCATERWEAWHGSVVEAEAGALRQALDVAAAEPFREDCRHVVADFMTRAAARAIRLGRTELALRAAREALRADPLVGPRLAATSGFKRMHRWLRGALFRARRNRG